MKAKSLAIILTIVLMVATGASADVPNDITYQGTLTDSTGRHPFHALLTVCRLHWRFIPVE